MVTTEYKKPVPLPDERTAGFWEAAKEHRLAFQQCQHCNRYSHPPVLFCPHCKALEPSFAWNTVSGRGKIKTWVVMTDPIVRGFEDETDPWVVAIIEVEEQEGLTFIAGVVDGSKQPIKIG